MSFGRTLTVLLIAIFATAVSAQSAGGNGTVEAGGGNNGTNSALFSFSIIANSTLDPLIKNAIETLRNATVNGTDAIRRAISEAARGLANNANVTIADITQFLNAAQRNLTAIGNSTLTAAIERLQRFVQSNQQDIQRVIDGIQQGFQNIISLFNATIIGIGNLFNRTFPLRPFPFPFPFPIQAGGGGSFNIGRR